jgi:hypothetical protein
MAQWKFSDITGAGEGRGKKKKKKTLPSPLGSKRSSVPGLRGKKKKKRIAQAVDQKNEKDAGKLERRVRKTSSEWSALRSLCGKIWLATVPLLSRHSLTSQQKKEKKIKNKREEKRKTHGGISFLFFPDCHGNRDGKKEKKREKKTNVHTLWSRGRGIGSSSMLA